MFPFLSSSSSSSDAAADRYRLIMQPERPQFGPNTALFASFLMFLSAIALSIPMFVSAKVRTKYRDGQKGGPSKGPLVA